MPIYEFRCEDCGKIFEILCFTKEEEKEVRCPYCNSKRVTKEYSTFATSWGRSFGFGSGACGGSGFGFG
ncbi:MAG: FmdB family zinc ribbon protein [Caldimicrobium sp.]|jgi:putative FmdB family regulatory protein